MLDALRKRAFLTAVAMAALIVAVELGSTLLVRGVSAGPAVSVLAREQGASVASGDSPPGRAILALALLDSMVLYALVLMLLGVVGARRIQGRVQGVATLVFAIVEIVIAIVSLLLTLTELTIMVSLFLSAPFGTLAYLAVWGGFATGKAATLLALLMALKLGVCWYLFTAQPRFTQNKGLVALLATSLLGNLLVGFLHAIVPRPVAAITDRLGAIIVAIAAIIWAVVLVIGSLPAIWKAARASA